MTERMVVRTSPNQAQCGGRRPAEAGATVLQESAAPSPVVTEPVIGTELPELPSRSSGLPSASLVAWLGAVGGGGVLDGPIASGGQPIACGQVGLAGLINRDKLPMLFDDSLAPEDMTGTGGELFPSLERAVQLL